MFGKCSVAAWVAALSAFLFLACWLAAPVQAYRVCTFKGTVIDHGWRTMKVKSNGQCAEVNVGWRTKYMPINRRPCLGEYVAVDFVLEDGYMKATKVVSLSPLPPSVECYPPPPPSSSVCRTVTEEAAAPPDTCPSPRAVCSTKPPAHVSDSAWSPEKKEVAPRPVKPAAKKPEAEKKPPAKEAVTPPTEGKEEPVTTEEKKYQTVTGEVVSSSPKSLSLRVVEEGGAAEVISVKVGLRTQFIPFRRPAVGEKVKVQVQQENGEKFGKTVEVIQ